MRDDDVSQISDANADAWTRLVRLGCDIYRDEVNMPAFLGMLPNICGLVGLDIGCGEGESTRALAKLGARMAAVDVSTRFVAVAREYEQDHPMGIDYQLASATQLPSPDTTFDFVTGFMSFMDIPEHERLVREAFRVLKPNGFLQFSLSHPCFTTPRWNWVCDAGGQRVALECGDYFKDVNGEIDEWIFETAPADLKRVLPRFRVPRFSRTLSDWLNLLIDTGFLLEHFAEPRADEETVRKIPSLSDTRIVAYFLIARCRKPGLACDDFA
jgi:ubiquinone/menaquinone biosynthesis C-methylase UbiE